MNRVAIINLIEEQGLMPLFFNSDIEVCKKVLNACYKGGARLMEFTNRGAFAIQTFTKLSKYAQEKFPDMVLGIGSITDAPTAALYIENGAKFIVTPAFRKDIALLCNRRKILWIPGCGSLTEIGNAEELGCEIVKLFPGSVYGPNFIKSIKGPQPWTKIMPTGGVEPTEENINSWFSAGAIAVGMGSKLIRKDSLENESYEDIELLVKKSLNLIQQARP